MGRTFAKKCMQKDLKLVILISMIWRRRRCGRTDAGQTADGQVWWQYPFSGPKGPRRKKVKTDALISRELFLTWEKRQKHHFPNIYDVIPQNDVILRFLR